MAVLKWFNALADRIRPGRRFRVIEIVEAADEIPEMIPPRGAVLVGSVERPTWVAFDCPCSEHHRVMLNLDRGRRPSWLMRSDKPLTISPSIDERRPEKRCHYFIRAGKVQWAHNSAPGGSR